MIVLLMFAVSGCRQLVRNPMPAERINLEQAVIVVDQSKAVHAKAADMLADEIEKRSGVRLAIVESVPEPPVPVIVLGTVESLGGSLKTSEVPEKAEGYAIWTESKPTKRRAVYLVGRDDRGALFAAGRLIRLLQIGRASISLFSDVRIATAPEYPIRGHQFGYRSLNNTSDAWDVDTYEQYIRDLIIFGTNSFELIPRLTPRKKGSYHMGLSMWEMNTALSEVLDSYDIDVWMWLKLYYKEIKTPELDAEAMEKRRALFKSFKRLDAVFVPGGDGGDTPVEILLPWLGRMAKVLREVHPNATLWVSNQCFTFDENDFFFDYMRDKKPDWLEGVVYGPWTRIPIAEVRRRTPKRYKLRRYPDISHCLGCQYPVPKWDSAFALTLGREPVCPRPLGMSHIHNLYAPLTEGFITYSDGVNDDMNKFLWSALGWDSKTTVEDILCEYSKVFFGDEYSYSVAQGLVMLEENWVGPILENDGIERTLSHWQSIAEKSGDTLANNWRMQLHLFRACYDAYLRRKVIAESSYEANAMKALSRAEQDGVTAAIGQARNALAEVDRNRPAQDLREKIETLGLELFNSIGFQSSLKDPYHASGARRGNVLDYLDRPLNDRLWLEAEFEKIAAMKDTDAQLAHLNRIINWEDAGDGGYYDDLGKEGKQPHLFRQQSWFEEPSLIRSPFDEHYYTKQVTADKLSWLDQGHIRYSMGTHPPDNKLTVSQQQRIAAEKLPLLTMCYDGLDPKARYRVRVTYYGRFRPENRLIADEQYEIHCPLVQPDPPKPVEFSIPAKATADGKLKLEWQLIDDARGSQVAEVWLDGFVAAVSRG
jgi:hypothetical protein